MLESQKSIFQKIMKFKKYLFQKNSKIHTLKPFQDFEKKIDPGILTHLNSQFKDTFPIL